MYKILEKYCFAAVGLHCCTWACSSCSEQGLLFSAVPRFLMQWLLLLRSVGARHAASVVPALGLISCSSRALELWLSSCGAWA